MSGETTPRGSRTPEGDLRPDPVHLPRIRRSLARRLHPDLDGDPSLFAGVMAALDLGIVPKAAVPLLDQRLLHGAVPVDPSRDGPALEVLITSTWWSRLSTRLTRASRSSIREMRRRLPARVPGSRRYGNL